MAATELEFYGRWIYVQESLEFFQFYWLTPNRRV